MQVNISLFEIMNLANPPSRMSSIRHILEQYFTYTQTLVLCFLPRGGMYMYRDLACQQESERNTAGGWQELSTSKKLQHWLLTVFPVMNSNILQFVCLFVCLFNRSVSSADTHMQLPDSGLKSLYITCLLWSHSQQSSEQFCCQPQCMRNENADLISYCTKAWCMPLSLNISLRPNVLTDRVWVGITSKLNMQRVMVVL